MRVYRIETLLGGVTAVGVREGLKEVFISAEVLGPVFSVASCTYPQRRSERLILHCRPDSHACGILIYEILQVEMYRATLGVLGFYFIPVQSLLAYSSFLPC